MGAELTCVCLRFAQYIFYQEPIQEVKLHAIFFFDNARGYGVCAAVNAVVSQASGISQGLMTAKSRLAKEGLTISCLELVAGHMAVNLASDVRNALGGFSLTSETECWLDSTCRTPLDP